jgi:hypothetical protein
LDLLSMKIFEGYLIRRSIKFPRENTSFVDSEAAKDPGRTNGMLKRGLSNQTSVSRAVFSNQTSKYHALCQLEESQ